MSQHQIVSCPGCGKRYSVPPGAAPGQFQCQDCSAVVVYGRHGEPAAAGPPAARPHGAGAAKKSGRAAAARKKIQARHAAEADEGRGRRPAPHPARQQSAMPYVLGIFTLGILVAGTVFLLQKSKTTPPPATTATGKKDAAPGPLPESGGGSLGSAGLDAAGGGAATPPMPGTGPVTMPSAAPPEPAPAPSTGGLRAEARSARTGKEPEKFVPVANPPTGGHYGKSQGELLMMLKRSRSELLIPLEHLPDTTADLRRQIDADVAKVADHDAGSDALRAADRLIKAGRAAIPRILSEAAKLDFSKYTKITDARDEGVIAQSVDEVLRGITGYDKIQALQYTPSANLADFQRNVEEWYVWWLSTGYNRSTFYKQADDGEDESL